jgi:hypothetical protein
VSVDIWLGAVTTLAGAGLGGAISFALNRQQMRDARVQRAEDDLRLKQRRSEDRRFDAYTNLSMCLRTYRDAIRVLEDQSANEISISDIETLARSVNTASALVFLIAESQMTYEACRDIVATILDAQNALHNMDRSRALWTELNTKVAQLVREFQVAARDELGVGGIDRSVFLTRHVPETMITPTTIGER